MIQSMTAFARESANTPLGVLTVELRTVNHRYLDCSFKLPDPLRALEPKLRELAADSLARGKLDCLIRLQSQARDTGDMAIDIEKLAAVLASLQEIEQHLTDSTPPDPLRLLQFPGIYAAPEIPEEELQQDALELFRAALADLQDNRKREGEKLTGMILERIDKVAEQVADTRNIVPDLLLQQRQRIEKRIAELAIDVDEGRLEQEIVYMAQKADVDEELDRLEAHVDEVRRTLDKGGPCGRRLDFLMQELNREANTLSSKSLASSTTQNAVELKVLIEQMREQIQNIE